LVGLVLLADVIPVYVRMDAPFVLRTGLLVLGLLAAFSVIHVLVSRRVRRRRSWLASIGAIALLVATYVAGGPGGLLLGRGEGELAAATFLGVSLLVAAARGDPGCEVTSIPGALFGQTSRLTCIVFSPIDRLEHRLRGKRAV